MSMVGTAMRHIFFPRAHGDVDRREVCSQRDQRYLRRHDRQLGSRIFFASPWSVYKYSCPPNSDTN